MTELQALKIAQKMIPGCVFVTVTNYKNWFVFGTDPFKSGRMNPIAVDKNTGKPMVFHPMLNDPTEYFKAVQENGHSIASAKESAYDRKVESGKDAITHVLRLK